MSAPTMCRKRHASRPPATRTGGTASRCDINQRLVKLAWCIGRFWAGGAQPLASHYFPMSCYHHRRKTLSDRSKPWLACHPISSRHHVRTTVGLRLMLKEVWLLALGRRVGKVLRHNPNQGEFFSFLLRKKGECEVTPEDVYRTKTKSSCFA